MSHLHLAEHLAIDDSNLAVRRDFIRLTNDDREVLQALVPWIRTHSLDIAKRFYDWQFSFAPTTQFFRKYAERTGATVSELRGRLEGAQAGYLESVFIGAQASWGLEFFADRLHIGTVHDRINLPFKWFVGSYCEWRSLLHEYLLDHYRSEGHDENEASKMVADVMMSVEKVFNLDIQAIGDSFIVSTLESLGMDVATIVPQPGQDRTEIIQDVKDQMSALASGVASSVASVNENIESVVAASEQLSAASNQIAERASTISHLSSQAASVADNATTSIASLDASSNDIEKVVDSIAAVANKTNLLALNATIEAARAGEAGLGFSVVAGEVKVLANRTAEATTDIASKIEAIRTEVASTVAALSEIVERVKSVDELQESVATSIDEQVVAIDELGKNLYNASEATSEIREQVKVFETI